MKRGISILAWTARFVVCERVGNKECKLEDNFHAHVLLNKHGVGYHGLFAAA